MLVQRLSLLGAMALGFLSGPTMAVPFDFTYSYANPYDASAQTYIDTTTNVHLYTEGTVRVWIPTTGGATKATTTPGVITYKFDFGTDTVAEANLLTRNPTFHWAYSEGYNYFYGSKDGTNWVQLLDVPPPAFGSANGGVFNGALPASLLGGSELWFKAELYSYGSNVACCGNLGRNTAQHSRWDTSYGSTYQTFKLDVNFASDTGGGTGTIPEPTTFALVGLGLAGIGFARKKKPA